MSQNHGDLYCEEGDELREPEGRFQEIVRRLAEAAMSVTHHDAADHELGYIHEVQAMERRFTNILRGKIKPIRKRAKVKASSS